MENQTIKITGDITKDTTEEIQRQLTEAYQNGVSVVLEMPEVIHIDDRGILFLIQLREFVKDNHLQCTLKSLSTEMNHLVTMLGLHDILTIRSAP